MALPVTELLENQRYWALTWGPPLLPYDWPAWSNVQGQPVQLARPPSMEGEAGWFVVRLPSTDADGWLFGTSFAKLSSPRPGGRASKRSSDQVRSRVWRKLMVDRDLSMLARPGPFNNNGSATAAAAAVAAAAANAASSAHQGSADSILAALTTSMSFNQMPKPTLFKLWQIFMELWNEACARHGGMRRLVPLDPLGLYLATQQHRTHHERTRRSQMRLPRLLLKAPFDEVSTLDVIDELTVADTARMLQPSAPTSAPPPTPQPDYHTAASTRLPGKGLVHDAASSLLPIPTLQSAGPNEGGDATSGSPTPAIVANVSPGKTLHMPVHSQHHAQQAPAAHTQGQPRQQQEGQQKAQHADSVQIRLRRSPNPASGPTTSVTGSGSILEDASKAASLAPITMGGAWVLPATRSKSDAAAEHGAVQNATSFASPAATTAAGTQQAGAESAAPAASSGTAAANNLSAPTAVAIPALEPPTTQPAPSSTPAACLTDTAQLITELLVATNYSRAAYGYVMAAGHMTCLTNLLHLMTISAHFNPISGASAEANNEALQMFTGIPTSDILLAEWRNTVFRPCHYLAVDRARRRLVLAIRGSLELGDICTDLTAKPLSFTLGGVQGHVHQGLMSSAEYVLKNTETALKSAAQQFPGWPLLVTGHSLGGGVAALLTLLLREPGGCPPGLGRIHSIVIAPAAVLNAELAEACREFVLSLINDADFVPRLSCYSVDRALLDCVRASPAIQMADNLMQTTTATWNAVSATLMLRSKSSANMIEGAPLGATTATTHDRTPRRSQSQQLEGEMLRPSRGLPLSSHDRPDGQEGAALVDAAAAGGSATLTAMAKQAVAASGTAAAGGLTPGHPPDNHHIDHHGAAGHAAQRSSEARTGNIGTKSLQPDSHQHTNLSDVGPFRRANAQSAAAAVSIPMVSGPPPALSWQALKTGVMGTWFGEDADVSSIAASSPVDSEYWGSARSRRSSAGSGSPSSRLPASWSDMNAQGSISSTGSQHQHNLQQRHNSSSSHQHHLLGLGQGSGSGHVPGQGINHQHHRPSRKSPTTIPPTVSNVCSAADVAAAAGSCITQPLVAASPAASAPAATAAADADAWHASLLTSHYAERAQRWSRSDSHPELQLLLPPHQPQTDPATRAVQWTKSTHASVSAMDSSSEKLPFSLPGSSSERLVDLADDSSNCDATMVTHASTAQGAHASLPRSAMLAGGASDVAAAEGQGRPESMLGAVHADPAGPVHRSPSGASLSGMTGRGGPGRAKRVSIAEGSNTNFPAAVTSQYHHSQPQAIQHPNHPHHHHNYSKPSVAVDGLSHPQHSMSDIGTPGYASPLSGSPTTDILLPIPSPGGEHPPLNNDFTMAAPAHDQLHQAGDEAERGPSPPPAPKPKHTSRWLHRHSAHNGDKELYPPGRVLWMVYADDSALGPSVSQWPSGASIVAAAAVPAAPVGLAAGLGSSGGHDARQLAATTKDAASTLGAVAVAGALLPMPASASGTAASTATAAVSMPSAGLGGLRMPEPAAAAQKDSVLPHLSMQPAHFSNPSTPRTEHVPSGHSSGKAHLLWQQAGAAAAIQRTSASAGTSLFHPLAQHHPTQHPHNGVPLAQSTSTNPSSRTGSLPSSSFLGGVGSGTASPRHPGTAPEDGGAGGGERSSSHRRHKRSGSMTLMSAPPPLASMLKTGLRSLKRMKSSVATVLSKATFGRDGHESSEGDHSSRASHDGMSASSSDTDGGASDSCDSDSDPEGLGPRRRRRGVKPLRCVYLVEAEREVFECMVLLPNSVTDHLPDTYYRALQQLAAGAGLRPGRARDIGIPSLPASPPPSKIPSGAAAPVHGVPAGSTVTDSSHAGNSGVGAAAAADVVASARRTPSARQAAPASGAADGAPTAAAATGAAAAATGLAMRMAGSSAAAPPGVALARSGLQAFSSSPVAERASPQGGNEGKGRPADEPINNVLKMLRIL